MDRPKHLNLFKIHLPITGIVSIVHRITGVLLVLSLPLAIWALQLSLQSESDFLQIVSSLSSLFGQLFFLLLVWFFVHHFFAGIRFLMFDIEIGSSRSGSRAAAWLVITVELFTMFMFARWWLL